MEYINLKTLMIEITDILAENKSLKNEVKAINELLLKDNNFHLGVIKDKIDENKSLKNEVKGINELLEKNNNLYLTEIRDKNKEKNSLKDNKDNLWLKSPFYPNNLKSFEKWFNKYLRMIERLDNMSDKEYNNLFGVKNDL